MGGGFQALDLFKAVFWPWKDGFYFLRVGRGGRGGGQRPRFFFLTTFFTPRKNYFISNLFVDKVIFTFNFSCSLLLTCRRENWGDSGASPCPENHKISRCKKRQSSEKRMSNRRRRGRRGVLKLLVQNNIPWTMTMKRTIGHRCIPCNYEGKIDS